MPAATLHLSALMCGKHRSKVIADIKTRWDSCVAPRPRPLEMVFYGSGSEAIAEYDKIM